MDTEKKGEGEDKSRKILLPMDPAMRLDCLPLGQSHGHHLGLLQVREANEAQAQWTNLILALGGRPSTPLRMGILHCCSTTGLAQSSGGSQN